MAASDTHAGPAAEHYTDAPPLYPGLLRGALQLVFWLLFRPTAWRRHVARIDPALPPDFSLAELSAKQARNPALLRLLFLGLVVWPLLLGLMLAVNARLDDDSALDMAVRLGVGVMVGLASALGVGLMVSAALSLLAGLVVLTGAVCFHGNEMPDLTLRAGWPGLFLFCTAVGVMFGVAAVLEGPRERYPVIRQAIGVLTGAVICAGAVALSVLRAGPALLMGAFGWAVPYAVAKGIGRPRLGAVAGTLGCAGGWLALVIRHANQQAHVAGPHGLSPWQVALVGILGMAVGLTHYLWRPVLLYPFLLLWDRLLYRYDDQRQPGKASLLHWNAAFWDEYQRLPLYGLQEHLLMLLQRNRQEGQAAMSFLSQGPQRWAARATQIELDARRLEYCTDVADIGQAHLELAQVSLDSSIGPLMRSLGRASQDVEAASTQDSTYNQRLALSAVGDRLDALQRELVRSDDRYAGRFLPVTTGWRRAIRGKLDELTATAEARQEIDSPYVLGVPLTERQEIFVGRTDVCARIEKLLLDLRSPPLLLYGQRRIGKTSLLNNLGRLLPSTIVPLFVDMQGPASRASDHAGLLYNLARAMAESALRYRELALPPLSREELQADPFTRFDEWLDGIEQLLGQGTALLALDEFAVLESALVEGRFHEGQVLGMLRNLIQHRRRFKVLLAGSHMLDEMQRFASYLINVQVVKIGYLNPPEARQLVEHPTRDFALRYEPEASRRVLEVTRGHPFLVQLLCAEIVALKNEQPPAVRRLARLCDIEQAVPEALEHGAFFFADIQRNQVDGPGLRLLLYLSSLGEGACASKDDLARECQGDLDPTLRLLLRRELIEQADGGYRFQLELIRRWFLRT